MKNSFIQSWPVIFLVVILGVVIFLWRQSTSLEQLYIARTEMELQTRARLLSRESRKLIQDDRRRQLQRFYEEEGKATETRITLIAPDGEVLADSEEEPARMDNHRMRPEIIGAINSFRDGRPFYATIRHSSTLGRRLIYCAAPIEIDGKTYVLRTAFSIHNLDKVVRQARLDILLAITVTALVAAILCYVIFRTVSRPVWELCRAAARISGGDLDTRLPIPERGVLRELGEHLSRMAEELKKRINEISREKSERDAIFAALAEGVIVLDRQDNVIDINTAARQIFKLKDEPCGLPVSGIIRNLEISDFIEKLKKEGAPVEAEFPVQLPSGDKQLRVRGTRLKWSEDKASGILLVIYDMTQLRKLENFRRDFVANVSHEIKTPLTVIRGAVETLRDGAIHEPESAERFMQIIEMLPVNVSTPISTAVELAQARADAAGLKLVVETSADPEVLIDVQLVEQAILNLIDNAIKHSGEKSEVRITAREESGEAVIEVADHGCGIPAEHLPRVFERFYRVDKARSRKAGGTGLGLAIVKHVMQLHHGSAEVRSTVGQGSTFTLRLPVCRPKA